MVSVPRSCTAKITNRGRRFITLPLSGIEKWVTVLELRIVDDATGEVLNEMTLHSAERDVLTLKGFYEVKNDAG